MFVLDEAFAVTLRNDEEVIGCLALLYFDFFGLAHDKLNFGDDVVFNFRIESEDQILLQLLWEDKSSNFLFKRGADHLKELVKFVLVI